MGKERGDSMTHDVSLRSKSLLHRNQVLQVKLRIQYLYYDSHSMHNRQCSQNDLTSGF